jgi:hypothetical protein
MLVGSEMPLGTLLVEIVGGKDAITSDVLGLSLDEVSGKAAEALRSPNGPLIERGRPQRWR